MTLVAPRTTQGFELIGNLMQVVDNGSEWEITPSLALKQGDAVVLTAGKVAKAAAGATNILGVMAEAVTAHATTKTMGRVYTHPYNVYRVSFVDHFDGTATGGTTTTLVAQLPVHDTDDDWNGALLYVYAGTNKGQERIISDYAHGTDTLTWTEPMPAACDTTTKFIILGEGDEAGASVIHRGTVGINLKNEYSVDANAAVDAVDGPCAALNIYPADLMMDVVFIKHRLASR